MLPNSLKINCVDIMFSFFFFFFFPFHLLGPNHTKSQVRKKQQQQQKKKKKKKKKNIHTIRRNWNKLVMNSVHHENIFYTSKYIQLSIELGGKVTFDIA